VTLGRGYASNVRILPVIVASALCVCTALAVPETTAMWSDGHKSVLSDEELVRYATASPGAGYPEEAQKKKLAGSGVYEIQVNKSGIPTAVAIVKSSGSAVLDQAARSAFLKWRFKAGVFHSVRVPVSWSVNRVK
jgi:TonB family protein